MKFLATIIWRLAEVTDVSLGRAAPWIFGAMIGRRPHKIK